MRLNARTVWWTLTLAAALSASAFVSPRARARQADGAAPAWGLRYGGAGNDILTQVVPLKDGGFVLAGTTKSFAKEWDVWVVRLTPEGAPAWQRTYGGPKDDSAAYAAETSDGGFLLAGTTESFGAGKHDLWALRLDAAGGVVWQNAYGGGGDEAAAAAVRTPDDGLILLFLKHSSFFGPADRQTSAVRIDSSGRALWQMSYEIGAEPHIAAAGPDEYVLGSGHWLVRIDGRTGLPAGAAGAKGEAHGLSFGEPSAYATLVAGLAPAREGFFVAANVGECAGGGETECGRGPRLLVGRVRGDGTAAWARLLDAGRAPVGGPSSFHATEDGGLLLAGLLQRGAVKEALTFGAARSKYVGFVAKLDAEGRLEWQRTYALGEPSLWSGETELATARIMAAPLAGGGYAQAGTSYSEETRRDFYLLKLAPGAAGARADGEDEGVRLKPLDSGLGLRRRGLRLSSPRPLVRSPTGAVPKAVRGEVRRIA
jgi:hypothetical protein